MSDEEYRQDFVEARRIRYFEERVKELEAENARMREALESARRVFFFDIGHMRKFGDDYNQAVVDAGNNVSTALSKKKSFAADSRALGC